MLNSFSFRPVPASTYSGPHSCCGGGKISHLLLTAITFEWFWAMLAAACACAASVSLHSKCRSMWLSLAASIAFYTNALDNVVRVADSCRIDKMEEDAINLGRHTHKVLRSTRYICDNSHILPRNGIRRELLPTFGAPRMSMSSPVRTALPLAALMLASMRSRSGRSRPERSREHRPLRLQSQ